MSHPRQILKSHSATNLKRDVMNRFARQVTSRLYSQSKKRAINFNQAIGSLKSEGMFFEGVPLMDFEERPSNWAYFMNAIVSPFSNKAKTALQLENIDTSP